MLLLVDLFFLFLFIWLFGLFVYIVYFPTPGRIRYIFRNTYSVLASGHMTVFVFVFSPFFFLPESLKRGTDRLVFVGIFQFHDSWTPNKELAETVGHGFNEFSDFMSRRRKQQKQSSDKT